MFYSTQILAKKGPLGLVWMAAHMDRGLKRNQVGSGQRLQPLANGSRAPSYALSAGSEAQYRLPFPSYELLLVDIHPLCLDLTISRLPLPRHVTCHALSLTSDMPQVTETSIPSTVDVLLSPEAPLALRLSGQLLLGVCRIYARKVSYLLQVGTWDTRAGLHGRLPGKVSSKPGLYSIAGSQTAAIDISTWREPPLQLVSTSYISPYALRCFGAILHLQDCQDALVKIRLAFRCVTIAGWGHTLGLRRHAHAVSHHLISTAPLLQWRTPISRCLRLGLCPAPPASCPTQTRAASSAEQGSRGGGSGGARPAPGGSHRAAGMHHTAGVHY